MSRKGKIKQLPTKPTVVNPLKKKVHIRDQHVNTSDDKRIRPKVKKNEEGFFKAPSKDNKDSNSYLKDFTIGLKDHVDKNSDMSPEARANAMIQLYDAHDATSSDLFKGSLGAVMDKELNDKDSMNLLSKLAFGDDNKLLVDNSANVKVKGQAYVAMAKKVQEVPIDQRIGAWDKFNKKMMDEKTAKEFGDNDVFSNTVGEFNQAILDGMLDNVDEDFIADEVLVVDRESKIFDRRLDQAKKGSSDHRWKTIESKDPERLYYLADEMEIRIGYRNDRGEDVMSMFDLEDNKHYDPQGSALPDVANPDLLISGWDRNLEEYSTVMLASVGDVFPHLQSNTSRTNEAFQGRLKQKTSFANKSKLEAFSNGTRGIYPVNGKSSIPKSVTDSMKSHYAKTQDVLSKNPDYIMGASRKDGSRLNAENTLHRGFVFDRDPGGSITLDGGMMSLSKSDVIANSFSNQIQIHEAMDKRLNGDNHNYEAKNPGYMNAKNGMSLNKFKDWFKKNYDMDINIPANMEKYITGIQASSTKYDNFGNHIDKDLARATTFGIKMDYDAKRLIDDGRIFHYLDDKFHDATDLFYSAGLTGEEEVLAIF